MRGYLVYLFILITILISKQTVGQTFTQTFIDKCSGETKIATTIMINGSATVSFYNQIKTFSPIEVQSGMVKTWLITVKTSYEAFTCPLTDNPIVQQAVANTVAQAATSAAASAASSAASTSASSAASSSASSAASSSTTPANSSNETQSPSDNGDNSSTSESKSEESNSDSNEEKKEEKKQEEKKKQKTAVSNPMLISSDLSTIQTAEGRWLQSATIGISRSSMAGDKSYSANAVVMSDLRTLILTAGYTKMEFSNGKLNAIHSYSTSFASLNGNYMNLIGYTWIKPTQKKGVFGYNVGMLNLLLKNSDNGYEYNQSTSTVAFWTKPYQYSKKLTLSPQLFIMFSPINWNTVTGISTVNRSIGFLIGSSFDYKISKRFGFSINYKLSGNTLSTSPFLSNILIGNRMMI
jgi:hypothetical protein